MLSTDVLVGVVKSANRKRWRQNQSTGQERGGRASRAAGERGYQGARGRDEARHDHTERIRSFVTTPGPDHGDAAIALRVGGSVRCNHKGVVAAAATAVSVDAARLGQSWRVESRGAASLADARHACRGAKKERGRRREGRREEEGRAGRNGSEDGGEARAARTPRRRAR